MRRQSAVVPLLFSQTVEFDKRGNEYKPMRTKGNRPVPRVEHICTHVNKGRDKTFYQERMNKWVKSNFPGISGDVAFNWS